MFWPCVSPSQSDGQIKWQAPVLETRPGLFRQSQTLNFFTTVVLTSFYDYLCESSQLEHWSHQTTDSLHGFRKRKVLRMLKISQMFLWGQSQSRFLFIAREKRQGRKTFRITHCISNDFKLYQWAILSSYIAQVLIVEIVEAVTNYLLWNIISSTCF